MGSSSSRTTPWCKPSSPSTSRGHMRAIDGRSSPPAMRTSRSSCRCKRSPRSTPPAARERPAGKAWRATRADRPSRSPSPGTTGSSCSRVSLQRFTFARRTARAGSRSPSAARAARTRGMRSSTATPAPGSPAYRVIPAAAMTVASGSSRPASVGLSPSKARSTGRRRTTGAGTWRGSRASAARCSASGWEARNSATVSSTRCAHISRAFLRRARPRRAILRQLREGRSSSRARPSGAAAATPARS